MAARPFRLLSPVGLACTVVFLHYVGAYMRMPLLPLYASEGGAGTGQVGLLMGTFMLVAAASSLPGGVLADRFGRRGMIVAGVAISTATSFALPLSNRVLFLMGVLALAGWAMAALSPAVMAYIGEVGGPDHAGRAYGWYTTALYGGLTLGPACGGVVADLVGFRPAFLASGAVLLASLLLAAGGLPEWRGPSASSGDASAAVGPAAAGAGGPVRGGEAPVGRLRRVAGDPLVLACWGAMFCFTFAWGVLLAFLPLYAQRLGHSRRAIGGLFAVQALANMGMRAPVGYLSDRLGVRAPFTTAGMLAFAAGAMAIPALEGGLALAMAIALTGFGQGVGAVAVGAALGEAVEPSVRGTAMGGYSMALYAGMGVGSLLAGPVIARAGYGAGFGLAAGVLVLGAGAFHRTASRTSSGLRSKD
jgi:MFS family permease